MKELQLNKSVRILFYTIYSLAILTTIVLSFYNIYIGISLFLVIVITGYFIIPLMNKWQTELYKSYENITYQVQDAGNELFYNLPVGIIIYNENNEINWMNPYMHSLHEKGDHLIGKPLYQLNEQLARNIEHEEQEFWCHFNDIHFLATLDMDNRTVFLFNRSKYYHLKQVYEQEKTVIANIYLDNYDELARNMEDNLKSKINSEITATLTSWAQNNDFYIKRTAQDRFLAILTEENLDELEESNFKILDEVRQMHVDQLQRNPITLSIGIGTGNVSINELASIAQSSLDLVLGRGGDQVAIRDVEGNVRFYGGKTNPMEKRTRVRARVISHALADLVKESENVIIMGHQSPDMDSLGAAIGVLKIAQANDVEGYIVYDQEDITTGINRAIDLIKEDGALWKYFIKPQEAEQIFSRKSLIIVVDTHRRNNVAHPLILQNAERTVIIDHHRRGEDFIEESTLVYMEPYASSTAELVTELIEYQPNKINLSTLEATTLLAGIIVDTKSFALRTGSRTFDAASYLRIKGADPMLIQQFLKEDLKTYVTRSKLIENAYLYADKIAVAKAEDDKEYNHIIIAQAADTLLTMDDVSASFVIAKSNENTVSISARSLGEINVQLIMEQLDGGGHLTNAATQIKDASIDQVEERLIEAIENRLESDSEE
ncbi:MAG TPA: DHH family phosphoesterase [Pseudogracilibacillus sp.]|nr:DHH family phosphoesterase [Pseudogracilibacillus sp.]